MERVSENYSDFKMCLNLNNHELKKDCYIHGLYIYAIDILDFTILWYV